MNSNLFLFDFLLEFSHRNVFSPQLIFHRKYAQMFANVLSPTKCRRYFSRMDFNNLGCAQHSSSKLCSAFVCTRFAYICVHLRFKTKKLRCCHLDVFFVAVYFSPQMSANVRKCFVFDKNADVTSAAWICVYLCSFAV